MVHSVFFSGSTGWNQTLKNQFGAERWRSLKKALKTETEKLCYLPPPSIFTQIRQNHILPNDFQRSLETHSLTPSGLPNLYKSLEPSENVTSSLPLAYFLDGASCAAALMLGVLPGDSVLDMCSAPGGKALILSSILFSENSASLTGATTCKESLLVCNEAAPARSKRLKSNVASRIPTAALEKGRVQFTECVRNYKALERLGPFDRILVDAPCSSDGHLARNDAKLATWTIKDVKANAERQYQLLDTALGLLRRQPNARVLYCTCALSSLENDEVVRRVLIKSKWAKQVAILDADLLLDECRRQCPPSVAIESISPDGSLCMAKPHNNSDSFFLQTSLSEVNFVTMLKAEKTEFGLMFLPDVSLYGPLYLAAFQWKRH